MNTQEHSACLFDVLELSLRCSADASRHPVHEKAEVIPPVIKISFSDSPFIQMLASGLFIGPMMILPRSLSPWIVAICTSTTLVELNVSIPASRPPKAAPLGN